MGNNNKKLISVILIPGANKAPSLWCQLLEHVGSLHQMLEQVGVFYSLPPWWEQCLFTKHLLGGTGASESFVLAAGAGPQVTAIEPGASCSGGAGGAGRAGK